MKAKKQSHSSTIALVHLVVGGFIIPLIGYGLLYFASSTLFPGVFERNGDGLLFGLVSWLISIGLLIGGVMYSSDYIAETYVIKEARVIVIKSTYYFAIFILGGFILGIVLDFPLTISEWVIDGVASIINAVVFYYVSQRFLPKAVLKYTHK